MGVAVSRRFKLASHNPPAMVPQANTPTTGMSKLASHQRDWERGRGALAVGGAEAGRGAAPGVVAMLGVPSGGVGDEVRLTNAGAGVIPHKPATAAANSPAVAYR